MARACTLSEREARHSLARLAPLFSSNGATTGSLQTPDGVHDVRVASRRARVFLAEFEDNLPDGVARKARKRLQKIGRQLGQARELDVSLKLLRDWPDADETARAAAIVHIEKLRAAVQEPIDMIDGELLRGEIAELFERVKEGFERSTACHLRHARGQLRNRLKKADKLHAAWWTSRDDEDLHALRISLKTFRYALEIHHRIYGKHAHAVEKALHSAQDSLGRWNDLRILHGLLTAMKPEVPRIARAGLAALTAAIAAEMDAAREQAREELGAFFEKDALKEYRGCFGDWSHKCCRGAR